MADVRSMMAKGICIYDRIIYYTPDSKEIHVYQITSDNELPDGWSKKAFDDHVIDQRIIDLLEVYGRNFEHYKSMNLKKLTRCCMNNLGNITKMRKDYIKWLANSANRRARAMRLQKEKPSKQYLPAATANITTMANIKLTDPKKRSIPAPVKLKEQPVIPEPIIKPKPLEPKIERPSVNITQQDKSKVTTVSNVTVPPTPKKPRKPSQSTAEKDRAYRERQIQTDKQLRDQFNNYIQVFYGITRYARTKTQFEVEFELNTTLMPTHRIRSEFVRKSAKEMAKFAFDAIRKEPVWKSKLSPDLRYYPGNVSVTPYGAVYIEFNGKPMDKNA